MIKSILMVLIFLAVLGLSAFSTHAVETSGSASVDVFSKYVWRGQTLSDESVVQPSVGITYGGFGANLWANYDTETNESNETDMTLYYANSLDNFSYDAGYIYYALDNISDTQEIYLYVEYAVILSPNATLYWDIDEGNGGYLLFNLSHSFEFQENMSFDLGCSIGVNLNNEIMGLNKNDEEFSGFYDGNISASLSLAISENISLVPIVAYSFPLSDDAESALKVIAEDATGDDKADIFFGGINASLNF